ncbi:MAG: Rod shape-determining protein RodA, partial [uncultured Rubrobacteraceae bacterium]
DEQEHDERCGARPPRRGDLRVAQDDGPDPAPHVPRADGLRDARGLLRGGHPGGVLRPGVQPGPRFRGRARHCDTARDLRLPQAPEVPALRLRDGRRPAPRRDHHGGLRRRRAALDRHRSRSGAALRVRQATGGHCARGLLRRTPAERDEDLLEVPWLSGRPRRPRLCPARPRDRARLRGDILHRRLYRGGEALPARAARRLRGSRVHARREVRVSEGVPDRPAHGLHGPHGLDGRRVPGVAVEGRHRLRGAYREGAGGDDAREARVPAGGPHGLYLLQPRREDRVRGRGAPARAVLRPDLADTPRRDGLQRPFRRPYSGRGRHDLLVPRLRKRGHDDGDDARHGDPAAVYQLRQEQPGGQRDLARPATGDRDALESRRLQGGLPV